MKTNLDEILSSIHHSIIVSCQALPDEPLYCEEMSLMPFMARAAKQAGAKCIRTSSARDVAAIKEETKLPVIGLIKRKYEGFDSYITTTMKEIDELVAVESDIIALDCTGLKRGDGLTVNEFIAQIKDKYPEVPLMADISTLEEGINAWKCGVSIVSTTMSGYTPFSSQTEGPDFELAKALSAAVSVPVIAEGRIHTPAQAKEMLETTGVHAIVVGGAITRPLQIAESFFKAI